MSIVDKVTLFITAHQIIYKVKLMKSSRATYHTNNDTTRNDDDDTQVYRHHLF